MNYETPFMEIIDFGIIEDTNTGVTPSGVFIKETDADFDDLIS